MPASCRKLATAGWPACLDQERRLETECTLILDATLPAFYQKKKGPNAGNPCRSAGCIGFWVLFLVNIVMSTFSLGSLMACLLCFGVSSRYILLDARSQRPSVTASPSWGLCSAILRSLLVPRHGAGIGPSSQPRAHRTSGTVAAALAEFWSHQARPIPN